MAVDDRRKREDLYEVPLRPHDERVEVAGWTYYVRAVKRDAELTGSGLWTTELLIDLPMLVVRGFRRMRDGRRPWIVGVVRLGSVHTWNDITPRVAYRETLGEGEDPRARIADLAEDVTAGRFAPSK